MRSSLFREFTQRRMVISYRRFGPTCLSYLQGFCLTLGDETDRLARSVGKKLTFYAAWNPTGRSEIWEWSNPNFSLLIIRLIYFIRENKLEWSWDYERSCSRFSNLKKKKIKCKRILQALYLKWKSFTLVGGGSNVKKKVPLCLLTIKVKVSSLFEDAM